MDLKEPGNLLYLVGLTRDELGGSHYCKTVGWDQGALATAGPPSQDAETGGRGKAGYFQVPQLDPQSAKITFAAMHRAIHAGLVRACHDLSEGGLAVAVAEMAFAGGIGASVNLEDVPFEANNCLDYPVEILLFSESNTRFLCEVKPENATAFEHNLGDVRHARIGETTDTPKLRVEVEGTTVVDADLVSLKEAWQKPLRW